MNQSETTSLKKYITLVFCLAFIQFSFGQDMDFSRVVVPEGQTPHTFEDQLVQWAWYNSPSNAIYKEQLAIAAQRKKLTWWELLDAKATFNINESHFLKDSILNSEDIRIPNPSVNNLFFPKYNLGVSINLGGIFARPAQAKIIQAERNIVKLEEQQQMLKVRAIVLQLYQEHELAVEVLKFKTQAAEEASSVYTLILEQFQNDKVDYKDFSAASINYHGANEAKAIAETEVRKAKIAIEEFIGIPWEKAVKRRRKK
ncbi:MAG: TolC family protein [Saprospiraceae bacterium]